MKVTSESKENLVPATSKESLNDDGSKPYDALNDSDEYVLTPVEKKFLLTAERGDCAGLRRLGYIRFEKSVLANSIFCKKKFQID